MFSDFLNWRTALAVLAIIIVSGTIIYSGYVSKKIKEDERKKIELWIEAKKTELLTENKEALTLVSHITTKNTAIPIIWANERDSIIDFVNMDTAKARKPGYLEKKKKEFKSLHDPIAWINPLDSTEKSLLYFGKSALSNEVKFYPIIQLLIVGLFIIITLISLQTNNRSTQNQVWAGMAKETAHQLGTPVSSLQGWVEVLKETPGIDPLILLEIEKDIKRLDLISDRFGKIGSTPKFVETDIVNRVEQMMDYMKKRASGKIIFGVHAGQYDDTTAPISPQLFDWVIENLYKNALDAMDGKGSIHTYIYRFDDKIILDVADTGKGLPRNKWKKIFKPGFTTKKRGWGLGLSLTRRIVEQYHRGRIYVKESEPGKGTTFRIILPRRRDE
jgi:nitrogen-specific signal transduction histidine kinase